MKQENIINNNSTNMNKDSSSNWVSNFVSEWLILAILCLIFAAITGMLGFHAISDISIIMTKWIAMIYIFLFIVSIIVHTIKIN